MRGYLNVVLICIALLISCVEHFFHVPIGQQNVFFREMSESSAHFLIGLFVIELYQLFVYFGNFALVSHIISNIFSHSIGCLFICVCVCLCVVSFVVQKLVSFIRSCLFIFAFISTALDRMT